MKRQVISHYNQSKQVLNDFFNNSDDDDEEADEDKDIQTMNDQNMVDDCEQYQKQDIHLHHNQNLSQPPLNSNCNIIHQSLINSTGGQGLHHNQFDISMQNIQQISKVQIGSLNNPDLFVPSCNNSLISQQNQVEDYQSVPPIQLNYYQHQELNQNFSQGKKDNLQVQIDCKSMNDENMKAEDNQDSGAENEDRDQDEEQGDIENSDEEDNAEEEDQQQQHREYQKDNNNNIQLNNIMTSSKQQIHQGNGMKYLVGGNDLTNKGDITKLPTSYNNTDDPRGGKSEGGKATQSGATLNQLKKIRLMQIETQNHNRRSSNPIDSHYKFSQSHRSILKREISLNFLVIVFYGIYLVIKQIFFEGSLGNSSQILTFWIASALILIGILGLLIIFVGLRNNKDLQSSSNSMNTKVIFSSGEKGALTDYSQRLQNNNNTNNNYNNRNMNAYIKQKLQMKSSNQPSQLSGSPQKISQSTQLKSTQLQNANLKIKQQIQVKQKQENNIQFLKAQQQQPMNSSSPSNSIPTQGAPIFKDERFIMTGVIILSVLSYILLLESIRLVNEQKSIILFFFIYHQFIIIYKLSASHFSSKFTLLFSLLLISYAIIRSKIFFYFNQTNSNNNTNHSTSYLIENTILDSIFAVIIFFQMYPFRLLAISPFLFHPFGTTALAREKILLKVGITSNCNIGHDEDEHEDDTKHSNFIKKMLNNKIKNKNLQSSKKTQLINVVDDTLLLHENTPLSPEIERQKSNHIKKMYQDILNVIPEGVALINSQNKLVYANKTLSKILQCSKNQIVKILLNLATKSKAEYDTTSQRGMMNNLNSPQYSKVHSLNQPITHPRATSQSIYKSFNSLLNNNTNTNNNNIISNFNINSQTQLNQQIINNNQQNPCPLDINNIYTNKINNQQTGNASNTNSQTNFPIRKVSAEMFDVKRKTSSTAKPSIFNRNHKTSCSKDESPAFYYMNSMGNNGTSNNIPYNQMLTQSNTKNLSTNGATPINLNFNTYQGGGGGGSDNRKQSMPYIQNNKTSPFDQTMSNTLGNHPLEDLFDKNAPLSQNSNRQGNGNNHQQQYFNQAKLQTNEFSDVMSLTHYIQQCPLGTCQINCIHNQVLFRENAPDASSFNDQFRSGINNIMNASPNPNQEQVSENLVRKQRSKKFKKSEIIRKDINVRDILSSIFENLKQTQQDQDTKTAKTFQLKKRNSDITSQQTQFGPQPTRKTSPSRQYSRQGSFLSQMKNQQQYIGYFQYVDDMVNYIIYQFFYPLIEKDKQFFYRTNIPTH